MSFLAGRLPDGAVARRAFERSRRVCLRAFVGIDQPKTKTVKSALDATRRAELFYADRGM
jgi:hypothetical protein